MLTFDEFRAVNNREKARAAEKKGEGSTKPTAKASAAGKRPAQNATPAATKTKKQTTDSPKRSFIGGVFDSIGDFLEVQQMQALYVILIVLDTFVSLAEMYLSCAANFSTDEPAVNRKVMVRLLTSFSAFTLLFFTAEIVAVVVIFGRSMLTHWGYLMDLVTTSCQIYLEQHGHGKIARMLNILRFWRMVRLLNAMVSTEKEAHNKTITLLDATEVELKRLQIETASLRTEIVREKEARDAIEDMLQNYKDEVDTLNEALKIAAMDIAEVAQTEDDFALSEEGDEEDEEDENSDIRGAPGADSEGFVDAASSRFSKAANKGAVMRAVMDDANGSVYSRGSTLTAASHNYGASTFLVHEDGTFEQK